MIVPISARIRSWSRQDLSSFLLPLLMLLTIAATVGALTWSCTNDLIVGNPDAKTHLIIARRVVDNITPGAGQLGGSWLPLLHVLELPFIWNDYLWHSGLAGGIVSTIAAWGSVFFAFRLAQDLSGSKFVGFVVALLLLFNANLLYMQTTPMNESLFICTILGSAHYLVRWVKDSRDQDLVLAGLFGLGTAFNRYEGWALILAQAVIVAIIGWRRRGWAAGEGLGLAYTSLAGLAPLLWFAWNWALFGSPFNFLTDPFSSRSNVGALAEAGMANPTIHNLGNTCRYFGLAIYHMAGPVLSLAAVAGLAYMTFWLVRRKSVPGLLPLLSLAAPGLFLVYALYAGQTLIYVPELPPYGTFNIRYGLYVLPFLLALAAFFGRSSGGKVFLASLLVSQLVLLTISPSSLALEDRGTVRCGPGFCADGVAAASYLKEHYDGGRILANGSLAGNELIFYSDLEIKDFIDEGNSRIWQEALDDPMSSARWVVMTGDPKNLKGDAVFLKLYDSAVIRSNYTKVFDRQGVTIYRRNDQVPPPSGVSGGPP